MPCPQDECGVRFECDACLAEHLSSVHATTYATVYGDVPEAWMERCPGHLDFPIERSPAGNGANGTRTAAT